MHEQRSESKNARPHVNMDGVVNVRIRSTDYALIGLDEVLPMLEQLMEYREATKDTLALLLLNYLEATGDELDTNLEMARLLELYEFLMKLEQLIVLKKGVSDGK